MKAVLLSIQPQWCEKIASGEKTVEVRKNRPKIDTPFKVYMYHTKTRNAGGGDWNHWADCWQLPNGTFVNAGGKVIGEFVCDEAEKFTVGSLRCDDIERLSCLTYAEMIAYFYKPGEIDGKTAKQGYGWHISELKIYDRPKELEEFVSCNGGSIKRPFQSWGYVCLSK